MTDVGPHVQTRSAHEQALAETFVTLADTLVDDYDVADLLDRLVTACVDLLGATAAGLLLDDQRGNLAVVASSSQETRMLELFALQTNEGPCLNCVRTGTAITSADLAREADRWPLFVPEALGAGFRSVIAVPLRLPVTLVGALALSRLDSTRTVVAAAAPRVDLAATPRGSAPARVVGAGAPADTAQPQADGDGGPRPMERTSKAAVS